MIVASLLTIRHFFSANFPASIFEGAFCDISAFLNCDSSAYSPIAHFYGVPMGFFGVMAGALVVLGTLFPRPPLKDEKFLPCQRLGSVGFSGFRSSSSRAVPAVQRLLFFSLLSAFSSGDAASLRPPLAPRSWPRAASFLRRGASRILCGARQQAPGRRRGGAGGSSASLGSGGPGPELPSRPLDIRSKRERFEYAPLRNVEYGFLCRTACISTAAETVRRICREDNIAFQFFRSRQNSHTVRR